MAWPNIYGLDIHRFGSPGSQPSKPTLALVHDAFHTPGHYDHLLEQLSESGFRTLAPQLPSSGSTSIPNALEADAQTLFGCCKTEIDLGRNVVMISHGYGSIPGSIAADRLNEYSLDRSRTGRVSKLITVAGVLLSEGESYASKVRPYWTPSPEDGLVRPSEPKNVFYHDCNPEDVPRASDLLQLQNESSLRGTVSSPSGWRHTPTLYIICAQDNCVPVTLQQSFAQDLRSSNAKSAVITLQSGHSPFLTHASQILELVLRVSGSQ